MVMPAVNIFMKHFFHKNSLFHSLSFSWLKTIGVGGQELVLKGERKIDNKRNEKGKRRSEKMRDRKIHGLKYILLDSILYIWLEYKISSMASKPINIS